MARRQQEAAERRQHPCQPGVARGSAGRKRRRQVHAHQDADRWVGAAALLVAAAGAVWRLVPPPAPPPALAPAAPRAAVLRCPPHMLTHARTGHLSCPWPPCRRDPGGRWRGVEAPQPAAGLRGAARLPPRGAAPGHDARAVHLVAVRRRLPGSFWGRRRRRRVPKLAAAAAPCVGGGAAAAMHQPDASCL